MSFESTHKLSFEIAPWLTQDFKRFRVGTCDGLWNATDESYDILAVTNEAPGNGHFEDVLEWFEQSCRRDKKSLRFLELWNEGLKKNLIEKRGFKDIGNDNVEKIFV